MVRSKCALLTLAVCFAAAGAAWAAAPPAFTRADSGVTVKSDAALDVKYRLTFQETEPRDCINTIGPLDPGHRVLDSHFECEAGGRP